MVAHADGVAEHTLRALYCELLLGRTVMPEVPYTGEPQSPLLPPIEIPKPSSLMPVYIAIVLGAMVIAGGVIIVISLLRPAPADNAALISAALVGVGVLMGQAMTFIKSSQAVVVATQNTDQIQGLHKSVNSGFEEFARLIRAEARAEGAKDAEEKQLEVAATEARIDAAVAKGISDFQARQTAAAEPVPPVPPAAPVPPTATATVNVTPEAVTVEEVKPAAAAAIAEAVRPGLADDVSAAVTEALPPSAKAPGGN